MMRHIVDGNYHTPYISLSKSFGVAENYARPSPGAPQGFVYEIELNDPLPDGVRLFDPVAAISAAVNAPLSDPSYHHDGDMDLLLHVIKPSVFNSPNPVRNPPGSGAGVASPNITRQLKAIARALRDAEIVAVGIIPYDCIVNRHTV